MGNKQSQVPDDNDDVPRYSYHENVLRDAQTSFINSDNSSAERVDNEDQYVSAEDSDSLHSLTPERTRPESSSNDSLSDNGTGNEKCSVEDWIKRGHEILTSDVDQHPSAATNQNANNTQTDVNVEKSLNSNDVSVVHKSNSDGYMQENITERSSNSFHNFNDSLKSSLDLSLSNKIVISNLSEDQTEHISNTRQFTPIQPLDGSSKAPLLSEEPTAKLGKRKILQDSSGESVLPQKRMLTRSSTKRKWLGYTDSSEYETGETEKEDSRKSSKKGRTIKISPKKSRRFDRGSRERDSDERRFGKKRCTRKSKLSCDSDSSDSDDDETENPDYTRNHRSRRNKPRNSHKRRFKNSCHESIDDSNRALRFHKKFKHKRQQSQESDSDEETDNVETRKKSYKHASSSHHDDNDGAARHTNNHQLQVSKSHPNQHQPQMKHAGLEDVHNTFASNTLHNNLTHASVVADMSNRPCYTFKMGNYSFRNSHGKVLPLKLQRHEGEASSIISDLQKNNFSDSSSLVTRETYLRPKYSDFVTLDSSVLKINKDLLTKNKQLNNVSIGQLPHRDSEEFQQQADSHLLPETIQSSPFKNVILTPSDAVTLRHPAILKLDASYDAGDRGSDMEVEESDVALQNQNISQSPNFVPSQARGVIRSRLRGKTVAARFKNFWSEKKKNIGENLKSLFSKVNSPPDKPLSPSSPIWQTFNSISSSSKNMHPLRNLHLKSDITFLNRNNPELSLATSLQNEVTSKQLQCQRHETVLPTVTGQHCQIQGYTRTITPKHDATRIPVIDSGVMRQELPQDFGTNRKNSQMLPSTASNSVEWLPQTIQLQVLNCRLAGMIDISVSAGDLADQKTAGIVNWTDGALTHSVTSCSRSVAAKAGALMRAVCNDYIETKGSNLEAPDVLTTPAGGRFIRTVEAILHVVEPSWMEGDEAHNSRALMEVFANCLRFANERLALDSISFPLIGNGIFPFTLCVESFFDAILVFLAEQSKICNLSHIQLIIPDITATNLAADLISSYLERVSQNGLDYEALATLNQYYVDKPRGTHQNINSETSEFSQDQNFTVERTTTGRPRLKRPRL